MTVLVEQFEENPHVFEPCVHALSVKWHHGVRGVAEDHNRGGVVVGCAFEADQREVWVLFVLDQKVGRVEEGGRHAGEVSAEEVGDWVGG